MSTVFGDANEGFQAHTIHGSVHNEFNHYVQPERRETTPDPSIVIPFSRDDDFVERSTLKELADHCSRPGSRTALVGLGGVGKSQLAIEHAYRTRDDSQETWVFWVHASNAARFTQSYQGIANFVKIPGRQKPKANILQLVHDWLQDKRRQWFLILDNVDDADFLFHKTGAQDGPAGTESDSSRPLVSYLPQCQNGSILITTRSEAVARRLVEPKHVLKLEPMSENDAYKLLQKKLTGQNDAESVRRLAVALDCMPLAIVQAAAYISQQAPRSSVQTYLDAFQTSDRKRAHLLERDGGQVRRDPEAKNSIMITWQMSFDQILEARPSAADLLSLMSFCDRQSIPDMLLRPHHQQVNRGVSGAQDDNNVSGDDASYENGNEGFEEDVSTLRAYSFISLTTDKTFEMHRLVQLARRKWLEMHKQLERWKQRITGKLYTAFPYAYYENELLCQALFPHVLSAVGYKPEDHEAQQEWATVMFRAARFSEDFVNAREAQRLAVKALHSRQQILREEHPATLQSIEQVAGMYTAQGRWAQAEEMFKRVMNVCERKFGMEHPYTLPVMGHLAGLYRQQGRLTEAGRLAAFVWEASERVLGAEDPNTLCGKMSAATILRKQGRLDESEELFLQMLKTSKRVLGAEHSITLSGSHALALTYMDQARWDEAAALLLHVVLTRKSVLRADHPDTLASIQALALTCSNQGRENEAEELLLQVVEPFKRELGAEHPDTLSSINALALTYSNQGRWDEAEALLLQVKDALKKELGPEHRSWLNAMRILASTYYRQGRYGEAEELVLQVPDLLKRVCGVDHPYTLTSKADLAEILKVQGRVDEAVVLMKDCLSRRQRVLDDAHDHTQYSARRVADWEAEILQQTASRERG